MGSICEIDPQISVVGAGPAGFALAADLAHHGMNVLIYSHPNHQRHAKGVIKKGHLRTSGAVERTASNLRFTCDMSEAVHFSRIIILTVPSTGQQTILEELRTFNLRHHTIIAVPGNLFSLILGPDFEVGNVLETNLSPYSCRMTNEGELAVLGRKSSFFIAALRNGSDIELRFAMQSIFPMELKWCHNVIEVCLSNINGVFHPLMMLMNAGRIESTSGDFLLYRHGLTRSVANAMIRVDDVRRKVGKAFGFKLKSVIEVSNECYEQDFTDLVDLAQNSPPHNKLRAPADIENRNISEDVPDLLVPWCGLAEKLGIDAAPLKAVIVMAEMATGTSYLEEGRNLRRLHLDDVSREELLWRFSVGKS